MSWAKAAASVGVAHGVAAEFDDHGLLVVALHVGSASARMRACDGRR